MTNIISRTARVAAIILSMALASTEAAAQSGPPPASFEQAVATIATAAMTHDVAATVAALEGYCNTLQVQGAARFALVEDIEATILRQTRGALNFGGKAVFTLGQAATIVGSAAISVPLIVDPNMVVPKSGAAQKPTDEA